MGILEDLYYQDANNRHFGSSPLGQWPTTIAERARDLAIHDAAAYLAAERRKAAIKEKLLLLTK